MTSFFNGIAYLFEKILFIPMDFFRELELTNWWTANIITWMFILICTGSFIFWIKQLNLFQKSKEDEQDTTAHSFLK
ncbi:uracil phosphoribosyltransferase [Flavobacterium sp. HSC-61S13]|uniref:DUF6341 family protein n=1 Tax=Flavobacterium sp. HSC-61S13 TaxID=2910963 RepID=UPI00209D2DCD|nr:uracil phosphoribosyltransferase [Flavobacterium sp. HSC-61S13]MCP1995207.1 phosphotransferase system glucose/maltose/N-acetylglucosamine-specific IIC component [Flavobacterium sp. HSC-61S13]